MSMIIQENIKKNLASLCEYRKGKVGINQLNENTYISTENMLPNKGGITLATSLPNTSLTQEFRKHDILVSNIRPYFKKIWMAEYDGGCSNDVLVFKAKDGCDPMFLYYVLADDNFFNYSTITAKGTKMPRGDKTAIMQYTVPSFDIDIQRKIGLILWDIDQKIAINNKINENLLKQLDALYQELSTREAWDITAIGELAEKIAMGPFGSNIKVSTFVPYGVPIISGNHLRGYFLEEPRYNYITEDHAEKLKNSVVYPGDVIFTHAGNIGQVAMIPNSCNYPKYVLSQRQFYLRCNKERLLPEYVTLFFHSKEGQHELLSYANQTGVPSIAQPASNLKKISLPVPPIQVQEKWAALVRPIIAKYQQNNLETRSLVSIRDALLPKLMSGSIDVSNIQI